MNEAASLYRLLGEAVRLRLLRVLARERLNVTELTAVLGLAQSGVSRHLGLLRDAGLVAEEPAGGFTYYRLDAAAHGRLAGLWSHLQAQFDEAAASAAARADDARLQEVLRLRRENFEAHGTDAGQIVPGRSWAAWARALGHLLPPLDVADLGCGDGHLTIEAATWARRVYAIDRSAAALQRARALGHLLPPLDVADIGCGDGHLTIEAARWARQVYAVDRSAAVLQRARALARKHGAANIVWKRGEIERIPLPSASVDVALLSQALHHAADPARALAEAVRILRPGGHVLLLDLRPHDQSWVKDRLGDHWLGFSDAALESMMRRAGLRDIRLQLGARRAGGPFTVTIASGVKGRARRPARPRRREN
jgi:ArsR family transcriptional regulator